jgi:HAD superfamily hydrolase (TIGR01458 family)
VTIWQPSGTSDARGIARSRAALAAAVCDDRAMSALPVPLMRLREQLSGVRGLLLDLDGVLVLRGKMIPGAAEALASLDAAGFPYLLATNYSLVSRATLSRQFAKAGVVVPPERIVSASSAAAAYARRHFAGEPIYVMVAEDALPEFEGLRLLSHDEAGEPDAAAAAVIVGDAGDEFTPRNLQSAFALLRGGARFVAMHKNRWWITPDGVRLDSGAYVAALEFGLGRRALVTGKPSRAFFGEGVRQLAGIGGGGGSPVHAAEVAMVGDDLWNDVRGAQRAGLRGVFVRSGKHGDAELARATSERGGRAPDAVAPSIAEIVVALLG